MFWYNVSYLKKGEEIMSTYSLLLSNRKFREINPIQAGWEQCLPGHSFGPAFRPFVLLHYVVSGQGTFSAGGRDYPLGPGQIFVIRPGEITYYQASQANPWHYIWIGFELGLPLPEALKQNVLTLPQAGPIFAGIRELAQFREGREAALCGKLWEIFSLLEREAAGEHTRHSRSTDVYVNQAKTYLETEYMRGVSIAGLAKQLNLDRSYFSKLFQKATGKSPQRYLTDLRLEKAAELLRSYGKTPGEAACAAGYPDVFSFSRMFKRRYGVSPREYQRLHR